MSFSDGDFLLMRTGYALLSKIFKGQGHHNLQQFLSICEKWFTSPSSKLIWQLEFSSWISSSAPHLSHSLCFVVHPMAWHYTTPRSFPYCCAVNTKFRWPQRCVFWRFAFKCCSPAALYTPWCIISTRETWRLCKGNWLSWKETSEQTTSYQIN